MACAGLCVRVRPSFVPHVRAHSSLPQAGLWEACLPRSVCMRAQAHSCVCVSVLMRVWLVCRLRGHVSLLSWLMLDGPLGWMALYWNSLSAASLMDGHAALPSSCLQWEQSFHDAASLPYCGLPGWRSLGAASLMDDCAASLMDGSPFQLSLISMMLPPSLIVVCLDGPPFLWSSF